MNLWPGIHVAKLIDDIDGNGHPGRGRPARRRRDGRHDPDGTDQASLTV
jgi:hypothetical protein